MIQKRSNNNRGKILLCNCAGCGHALLGDSYRGMDADYFDKLARVAFGGSGQDVVAGRVQDRPYCSLSGRGGGTGVGARQARRGWRGRAWPGEGGRRGTGVAYVTYLDMALEPLGRHQDRRCSLERIRDSI
jgi:hypothetical protein